MGFTNQQTGPGISAHVAGFKGDVGRRQRPARWARGQFEWARRRRERGRPCVKFAAWLLKLEGLVPPRTGRNQYAPGQFLSSDAYASKVIAAYGPRPTVSIPVALMDSSRPMMPGDPGYKPTPSTPQEIWGGPGIPPPPAGGHRRGIPIPGLSGQSPNAADILNALQPIRGQDLKLAG